MAVKRKAKAKVRRVKAKAKVRRIKRKIRRKARAAKM